MPIGGRASSPSRRAGDRASPGRSTTPCSLLAYATPPALLVAGAASFTVLLPLASAPLAIGLRRAVRAEGDARRLNPVLRQTARLSLLYSVLLAAGLALAERC